MKRLAIALILLLALCATPARATIAFVKAANNNSTSATATTVTISTSSGSLIVILVSQFASATSTVAITDSAAQTGWTQIASGYETSATTRSTIFYRPNSAVLSTVTATWSGPLSTDISAVVFEISGAALTSPEDTSVNATQGAVTTATSGTFTTTNANDILIFGGHISGSFTSPTAGASYTIPTNGFDNYHIMEYRVVSATQSSQTTTFSWTSVHNVFDNFVAFKASAAVPTQAGAFLVGP